MSLVCRAWFYLCAGFAYVLEYLVDDDREALDELIRVAEGRVD